MGHTTRLLPSSAPSRAFPSGSPHFALWRVWFSLTLIAACVLVLPQISRAQKFASVYDFSGMDGSNPFAGVIQATDGFLYGMTYAGGANNMGTVFQIAAGGKLTTLHTFSAVTYSNDHQVNTDGAHPLASLMQASDGFLYGTTWVGGTNGTGTIFRITTGGTLTTLYNFSAFTLSDPTTNADGAYPVDALMQASDGFLYGTTSAGGPNATGTVFKITTGGTLTTLYSFSAAPTFTNSDGANPSAGLVQARDGFLYGTTRFGGLHANGTVFQITTDGKLTTLHSFSAYRNMNGYISNADGAFPQADLIQATDGFLYGTAVAGGAHNDGTIFQITTSGAFTTVHSFRESDGANPLAGLVQASDGFLYGTTQNGGVHYYGTAFRLTTGGALTTLHNFSSLGASGLDDQAGLIQTSDGDLYGATIDGGANGYGMIYALAYDVPVLTSFSPVSINAGGPAFTLTVTGTTFESSSVVEWTQGGTTAPFTTPLITAYVSGTQLTAVVPASLIAAGGKVTLTVRNGLGISSEGKTFNVWTTTLRLLSAKLTRDSAGDYTASISLKNGGYLTTPNVTITQASLGAAATSTTLPVNLGSIAKGKTGAASLGFPASAGASGAVVILKVTGTFTGGSFSGALKVTLP